MKILKDRKLFEHEIGVKQSEAPSLSVLSFKASIDHKLLDNLVFIGQFESIAPNTKTQNITDDHIIRFMEQIIERNNVRYKPKVIEKSVRNM